LLAAAEREVAGSDELGASAWCPGWGPWRASRALRRSSAFSERLAYMLIPPDELIHDFGIAASAAGTVGWPCETQGEVLSAPHRPPSSLRAGFGAVYAFALRSSSTAPAGGGRVLKVGKAGPNSMARFTSQHYSPGSARSTLAGSIIKYPILWPWLGITAEDAASIRSWMTANLDRLHIFVRQPAPEFLTTVELYVRARIGSVYEGSA
jgi:hypothetical protein